MTMTFETAIAIGSTLGFIATSAAALFERMRSGKRDRADTLTQSLIADRDAWKSLHEAAAAELAAYRETAHRIQNEANARVLQLTEDNAKLNAATDIRPVLAHQAEQNEINTKILSALDTILDHLRTLKPCKVKPASKQPKKKTP